MNDNFFLDTNIIVYSFDQSSAPKAEVADRLLRHGLLTRKGVISYQVVQEFFNVARRRSPGPMRLERSRAFPFDSSYVRFALFTLRPLYFIELFSLSSGSICSGMTL